MRTQLVGLYQGQANGGDLGEIVVESDRPAGSSEARYDFDWGFDSGLSILLKGIEVSAVDAGNLGED